MRSLAALLIGLLFAGALRSGEAPSFREREALAKLQAMDLFPDLEDGGSQLAKLVSDETNRIEREQPAFFKEPAWPVRVARRAAEQLGIQPRTVTQIRESVLQSFDVGPEEFRRIHGIAITSAQVSAGGEWLDVTPQIAARVSASGLAMDCERTLLSLFSDESQFERQSGERDAEFWKRQRGMVAAAAERRDGKTALRITFEFHSEPRSAVVNEGERLTISEEGKVTISKIAPEPRVVRAANAGVSTTDSITKKTKAVDSKDAGKPANGRMPPR